MHRFPPYYFCLAIDQMTNNLFSATFIQTHSTTSFAFWKEFPLHLSYPGHCLKCRSVEVTTKSSHKMALKYQIHGEYCTLVKRSVSQNVLQMIAQELIYLVNWEIKTS